MEYNNCDHYYIILYGEYRTNLYNGICDICQECIFTDKKLFEVQELIWNNDWNIVRYDGSANIDDFMQIISKDINRDYVNQSYILHVVKHFPAIILTINKPNESMWIRALKSKPKLIQYVKNPTERMQLVVVSADGELIRFIENPTVEVQKKAIIQNRFALRKIDNPSNEILAFYDQKYNGIEI
jgi:hypothetical protein